MQGSRPVQRAPVGLRLTGKKDPPGDFRDVPFKTAMVRSRLTNGIPGRPRSMQRSGLKAGQARDSRRRRWTPCASGLAVGVERPSRGTFQRDVDPVLQPSKGWKFRQDQQSSGSSRRQGRSTNKPSRGVAFGDRVPRYFWALKAPDGIESLDVPVLMQQLLPDSGAGAATATDKAVTSTSIAPAKIDWQSAPAQGVDAGTTPGQNLQGVLFRRGQLRRQNAGCRDAGDKPIITSKKYTSFDGAVNARYARLSGQRPRVWWDPLNNRVDDRQCRGRCQIIRTRKCCKDRAETVDAGMCGLKPIRGHYLLRPQCGRREAKKGYV